ncbi:outer membrane lipoprotein carrier protein LolA [Vibrio proteolyticus]
MRMILTLMALLLPPLCLAQVTDLMSLQHQLAQHNIVRGEFTQQREIAMFDQPLESSGQFVLDKKHGLLWQQTTPFPVNLVLTEDKLQQTFADQSPQVVTAQDNPMAFYFTRVFLAVFHGDTAVLKQQFELSFHVENGQWVLILTPKQAPLDKVFQHITLSGQTDIEQLTLQELRGDNTRIQFHHQTHQPETLSDAEQTQFDF